MSAPLVEGLGKSCAPDGPSAADGLDSEMPRGAAWAPADNRIAWGRLVAAHAPDAAWLAAMSWVFMRQFQATRARGTLLNIGEWRCA